MCQEKQCSQCLRFLPLVEFHKSKAQKDGHQVKCKQCQAEYHRKYYEANKDKAAECGRKYREANKEKIAERKRKYREANKEKIAVYHRKYHEANKDKALERERKYREAKRAEKAQTAVFRGLDKDKLKELKIKLEKLEK